MTIPTTVRRRARLAAVAILTAALTGGLLGTVGTTTASAVSSGAARPDLPGWLQGPTAWQARHDRTARLRAASAIGPASPAAVPAALKDYLAGDRTDLQWPLQALHVREAWSAGRGDGVVVATIDTGADPASPELAGQLLPAVHLDPGTGAVVAGYRADQIGHGTHVAGIIAAKDDGRGISGIAPGAKILPINVDTSDDLTGKQVAAAITYASTHGAKVINLSLGFADVASGAADVKAICTAVTAALARRVVVVAAAGNDGTGSNNAEAPASCPGAISVAAVDTDLRPATWSSYDGSVTVAAPGSAILSSVVPSTSPLLYSAETGTSMAAPFVTGLAALLVAQNPGWTPAQVADRIAATAADVTPAGRDPRTGAGVIDPPRALGVSTSAPEQVPAIAAAADVYASRVDPTGRQILDQVLLHWVPDPVATVTGYRVTRWTSTGVTTTTYPAQTVRAVFPTGPAGYQVVALTDDGEVASAPTWFPLPGQDPSPVFPVTGLKASWTSKGAVTLRWTNPKQNASRADEYAVVVNGEVTVTGSKRAVPSRLVIPAAQVPPGDLSISLFIGSSSGFDVAETRTTLAARVPFSGTAVAAGKGRYRVDLALAPSRQAQCGRSRCTGALVTVTAGRYRHVSRLDSRGHVVVLVSARPRKGRVTVAVVVSGRPRLADRAVSVPVK